MREHMHYASKRRDERLARIRKLSLWITGGAAAASLGLGTAFAHELPGHTSAATSTAGTGATAGGSQQPAGSVTSGTPPEVDCPHGGRPAPPARAGSASAGPDAACQHSGPAAGGQLWRIVIAW